VQYAADRDIIKVTWFDKMPKPRKYSYMLLLPGAMAKE
jgi:hypothetical protein